MGIPLLLFRKPDKKRGGVTPWYLVGGVSASNCVAAYQPIGASSLAASYINLVNPGTNNAAPGTAPTWNAIDGWIFDGTNNYLTTGIVPVYQTWSVLIRFTDVTINDRHLFGAYDAGFSALFGISPKASGGARIDYSSGGDGSNTPIMTSGNLGIAGNLKFKNGLQETGTIPSISGTSMSIFIGGINSSVGILNRQDCKIQAFAIYNTILTPTQVAEIVAKMAVLPL